MRSPKPQKPILRLLAYAKGHRIKVILASLCSAINKLFDIAPEILIGVAIDVVVSKQDSFLASFGFTDAKSQLIALAVLTFIIWLGESIFQFLYAILWRNLAQTLQHQMRTDTYDHMQHMDMSFFENQSSGNLTSILNDDVNQLERFLNVGANDFIQVIVSVLGVGAVFFYISVKIAVFAFLPIPLIIFGAFFFQRKAQPRYAEVRKQHGRLAAAITNKITGIATIKSFTREKQELKNLTHLSQEYLQSNKEAIKISAAFTPIIRMAILTGFLATFIIGGFDALDGVISVGAYGMLVFLTQRLLWPFTSLAVTMDLYERAMASVRRILDLLETPIAIRDKVNTKTANMQQSINFHNVNFSYTIDSHKVLTNINMTIEKSKITAFVGQTGSGKSTLMKLLLRFYNPDSGNITIGNIDICDLKINQLRKSIGLVSQDIFLFDGSIKQNIAYGKDNTTDIEIQQAAKLAEAIDFITALPQGFNTLVGERGMKLSGGQRQRISLARAILKNPKILILDEATSAVDNETEAAIQKSMVHIAKNRTLLVVAHRLSTIVNADIIHVLDKGQIIESGTHVELLNYQGTYYKLWNIQTGNLITSPLP
ncbi:Efflux ABC transporter, permease/ATP-binding protein slr2019 [hydrothermal vent metagenome]|uniref:Efflux ABC transporter, permease/ATP-binding protein slr2019 n=1 Tax=hydrothermal vent metagenome TaxID=652676 RepID=A0A3B0V9Y9_9ZZZZ